MAAPKNTKSNKDVEPISAADELEKEISDEELLADLPELRSPERLRIRHRNRIMSAYFKAERNGLISDSEEGEDEDLKGEKLEVMFEFLADVDDFAESIAIDLDAYVEWAEKNSSNYPAYMALMRRYVSAVGESNGSSS